MVTQFPVSGSGTAIFCSWLDISKSGPINDVALVACHGKKRF